MAQQAEYKSIAAVTIATTKRPTSGATIGYRVKVAHINKARFHIFFQEFVQSFAPKYLIAESGDYTSRPTREQVERFLAPVMAQHGITELRVEM